MSTMSYEQQERLYHKMTARTAEAGIDGIMVEIAEHLMTKHPWLSQKENKFALLMAVELKFDEMREAILFDERMKLETQHIDAQNERAIRQELIDRHVISEPISWDADELPF